MFTTASNRDHLFSQFTVFAYSTPTTVVISNKFQILVLVFSREEVDTSLQLPEVNSFLDRSKGYGIYILKVQNKREGGNELRDE